MIINEQEGYLTNEIHLQVAAFSSMAAAAYMRIFLEETRDISDTSTQPLLESESGDSMDNGKKVLQEESPQNSSDASIQSLLKSDPSNSSDDGNSSHKVRGFKKIPSIYDIVSLLGSRCLTNHIYEVPMSWYMSRKFSQIYWKYDDFENWQLKFLIFIFGLVKKTKNWKENLNFLIVS